MERILRKGLDLAQQHGATYADIRVTKRDTEDIAVRNGNVENINRGGNEGFGVRVLKDGAFGFAATPITQEGDLEAKMQQTVAKALLLASAAAKVNRQPVELAPTKTIRDTYSTPLKIDPFMLPLEQKLQDLVDITKELQGEPEIRLTTASLRLFRDQKTFASTEGSYIEQTITQTGVSTGAVATSNGRAEHRTFTDHGTGGYELIGQFDPLGRAPQMAKEAVALLNAASCPVGDNTLILSGDQVALQLHESTGHPTELDRVLGSEATYAGTSFLMPEMKGQFRYGSPEVNINMDATIPQGLGTFAYDDEGVPAQDTPLIKSGIFVDYTTSRETAPAFGQLSNGSMVADGWNNIPLIRMTNISLQPGDWTLEEMIKDTKRGVMMDGQKSWSLDDKRMNFHFGCEIGWEIENGEITRLLKNVAYTDLTPHFWNACDAVANKDAWHCYGMPSCAKGEPVQIANVGHGAAPARFRNIKVGVEA
ncbi:MAG: TldD/PmbA family protein [Bacillota bacterium]|jgi:TldD protein